MIASTESSDIPLAPTHAPQHPSRPISLTSTSVTTHEPTLIHHYHPKSTVYLGLALDAVHSMGLVNRVMTCIHH